MKQIRIFSSRHRNLEVDVNQFCNTHTVYDIQYFTRSYDVGQDSSHDMPCVTVVYEVEDVSI